ncbi:hypothetical protein [Alkalibacillus aidingensis]|uniref:hypothetical protein n=1 Tax=Alkalibacillus aidingensis TaxID=2747607 RepID=UPI001660FE7E|nr:hypothetical protein [Alkalibacillus aidingensis]
MDTIFFFLMTIFYLCLLLFSLGLAYRHGWLVTSNVLLLVILALVYDNGIQAFGKYIGEGDLLETLNEMRYWLHAFITPLLVLFAWDTVERVGVLWAKKPGYQLAIVFLTMALIIVELMTEVWVLSLEPNWHMGVLTYDRVQESGEMPVMIMVVTVSLLIASIIVGRLQTWFWYFIGVFIMTIGMLVDRPVETGAYENFLELILMTSLVATKAFQDYHLSQKENH